MPVSKLQIQAFFSRRLSILLLGLVVLGLLGGYYTYTTHVSPGTEVEQIEQSSWSSTAEYDHYAVVETDAEPFEQGAVLEHQPRYLTAIAPVVNGTYRLEYRASHGCELSVTVEQTRILRSVSDDEEFEVWRTETHLLETSDEIAQSGEAVTVPFSVNVTAARQRIDEIESQLQQPPGETDIRLESRVTIVGQRNGESINETVTHGFEIEDQGAVYSVHPDEGMTDSGQTDEEKTVTATYGPLRSVGAPILVVLSVTGIVGLIFGHTRNAFEIASREREWLDYRETTTEYSSWLSDGTLPDAALARPAIDVADLEGLVDVAIDSNRRVIRDRSRGLCAVVLPESIYTFDIPPSPRESPDSRASPGEKQSDELDFDSHATDGAETADSDSEKPIANSSEPPDQTSPER